MIREKAIFIKLNQLHFSDQQIFDTAVSDFTPSKCTCPKCGAVGRFLEIHPYKRDLISIDSGRRTDTTLSIPRYRCESCGRTHALLPDVLIPYGSYSLRFILFILQAYLKRSCTVAEFCEGWSIAISTLYDWIHLFIDQYNVWCRILDRILWVSQKATTAVSSSSAFPSSFFLRFGFSFLQGRKTSLTGRSPSGDRRHRPWLT